MYFFYVSLMGSKNILFKIYHVMDDVFVINLFQIDPKYNLFLCKISNSLMEQTYSTRSNDKYFNKIRQKILNSIIMPFKFKKLANTI